MVKYYFLVGDPISCTTCVHAVNEGYIPNSRTVSVADIESDVIVNRLCCDALDMDFHESKLAGFFLKKPECLDSINQWLATHGAQAFEFSVKGWQQSVRSNIPDSCIHCGGETKGFAFCGQCGGFNVLKSAEKPKFNIPTIHKNPLSLLDLTPSNPAMTGVSSEDILDFRYQMSHALQDSELHRNAETEFLEKLTPLMKKGVIGGKTFQLWLDYWLRLEKLVSGCKAKNEELRTETRGLATGHGNLAAGLDQMLDDAISSFPQNSDELTPLLDYAWHAEEVIRTVKWFVLLMEYCTNLPSKWHECRFLRAENDSNQQEANELDKSKSCTNISSAKILVERLQNGIHGYEIKLTVAESGVFDLLRKDFSILTSSSNVMMLDIKAWIGLKLCGLKTVNDAEGLATTWGYSYLASLGGSECILKTIEALDNEILKQRAYSNKLLETAKGLLVKFEDAALEQEELAQQKRDQQIAQRLAEDEQRQDERERKQSLYNAREARIEASFKEEKLFRQMQEQFMTRQVALRQKAEGKYFLSTFTEAFGADAGTFWEGVGKK